jgi:hypothetical protein
MIDGTSCAFDHWSDAGSVSYTISFPVAAAVSWRFDAANGLTVGKLPESLSQP